MKNSTVHESGNKENSSVRRLLETGERIKDIRGGPFHTVVLTSKGRIFYAGNLYRSDSLLKDECTS